VSWNTGVKPVNQLIIYYLKKAVFLGIGGYVKQPRL
jgi:hypothetical protein